MAMLSEQQASMSLGTHRSNARSSFAHLDAGDEDRPRLMPPQRHLVAALERVLSAALSQLY